MIFLYVILFCTTLSSNFIISFDQKDVNQFYFELNDPNKTYTNIALHNSHEQSKSRTTVSYGGYINYSEPFYPTTGILPQRQSTTQKNINQLHQAQRAAILKMVTQRISEVANFYKADISGMSAMMQEMIKQVAINKTMSQSTMEHLFVLQIMDHLVKTDQTHRGIITRYQQHPWVQKKDLSNVTTEEKIMVNYMLDCMINAQNDMTIELAQSGLQSWIKSYSSRSVEEYEYHTKKSNKYYAAMQEKLPTQSITQQAQPIQKSEIDRLLQSYDQTIQTHQKDKSTNQEHLNDEHISRLEKRSQALIESKKQLNNTNLTTQTHAISPQARGYLMANNMNYAAFDTMSATKFQHCLTQEILGIIESSVGSIQHTGPNSIAAKIAYHNCNLAISAQQLNQSSRIQEAVSMTDLAHFFDLYRRSVLVLDPELAYRVADNVFMGTLDGTAKALINWYDFTKKACIKPQQTIGKLGDDCKNIGQALVTMAAKAGEFTPFAYLDDMMHDMQDRLDHMHEQQNDQYQAGKSRMWQRSERNFESLKNGLYSTLDTGEALIAQMMDKSVRENVCDISEMRVDITITDKAFDAIVNLSQIVGNQALQAAESINQNIPPSLLDSSMSFVETSTGELVAIADSTGESISVAMASQIAANRAEQSARFAAKTKELNDKINEKLKPNKKDVEAFHKEIEPFLSCEELVNVERLKATENIDQIEAFRKYTDNFKNLDKLKPEEILYLNLCDWLAPKVLEINEKLRGSGGLKFIDPATKVEVIIKEFDLFHSLLGEMKPQALANRTSGGHLFIPELKAATLDIHEIKQFGKGYFDMGIKYAGKQSTKYKPNSYFPIGTSIEQAVEIIEDTISNKGFIEFIKPENISIENALASTKKTFEATHKHSQKFTLHIDNGIINFYPNAPK